MNRSSATTSTSFANCPFAGAGTSWKELPRSSTIRPGRSATAAESPTASTTAAAATTAPAPILDGLAADHPDRVVLYRQPPGVFWDGKRAMVNAPLANIDEECLLWQIDADELWTANS